MQKWNNPEPGAAPDDRRTGTLAHGLGPIPGVSGEPDIGTHDAMYPCMRTQWWKLGRPALVGFVVGLVVTGGLAFVAPHPVEVVQGH